MKYAILSTDSSQDYITLLPLTAYSWMRIGFIPVIIHVDISEQQFNILKKYCPKETVFIGQANGDPDKVKSSTVAQVSRLFVHRLFQPDDILVIGDADMLIVKNIFQHEGVVSYGFDLTGRSEIPMCYFLAPVKEWAAIIGNTLLADLPNAYSEDWNLFWSVDQQLLTQKAREYGFGKITFIDRGNDNNNSGLPIGRWDRFNWKKPAGEIIDVHMLRSPLANWDRITEMCVTLWPDEDWDWLAGYKEELENRGTYIQVFDDSEMKSRMLDQSFFPRLFEYSEQLKRFQLEEKSEPYDLYTNPVRSFTFKGKRVEYYSKVALQQELDHVEQTDSFGFLKDVSNWNNHRSLLLLALSLTQGAVVEYGSGDGSTPYLKKYCDAAGRAFNSYDSNLSWCTKTGAEFIADWDAVDIWKECSVAFIDHAPGEHRHIVVKKLKDLAEIIVCHDSELYGAGNYMYDKVFPFFKYQLHYNRTGGGAGAMALSNTIDVAQFRGLSLGDFKFDA